MTPEETQLLAVIGSGTLVNLMRCSVEFLFWGIHAVLSIAALVSIGQRGFTGRPAQFIFVMLTFVFVLNTYSVFAFFAVVVKLIQARFIHNLDLSLEERMVLSGAIITSSLEYAIEYFANVSGLIYIIGDVVILWRAWKIWLGPKVYLMVPTFLVLATFAFSLTSTTLGLNLIGPDSNTSAFAITGVTSETCSLAANLVTTAMIGLQVYQHRQRMKEVFGTYTSRHWRIMLFITEAGVVYLIIQAIEMALALTFHEPFTPLDYAFRFWMILTRHVSATYPAIVVLMTEYNRSLANDTAMTVSANDIGTHISFGSPPVKASALNGTNGTRGELSYQYPSGGDVPSNSVEVREADVAKGEDEKATF